MSLPADYHMHTPLCRHAVGEPTELAAQAVRLGFTEIGFSEHNPMPRDDWDDWHPFQRDFDAYVAPSDRAVVNAGAVVAGVGIVVPELVKRIDPAAAWGGMELGLDLLLVGIGWALLTPGFGARAKQQRAQEELTRTLKLAVANATLGPH